MKKNIYQDFDGYPDIVNEIEISRRYGANYTADTHAPEKYINLLHPARLRLRVSDIIEETHSAKTLRLVSEDRYLPPFLAGQYISLFLEIGNIRTARPYSISSPPNQTGYYDITVGRVQGGRVSNYLLDEVKRGDLFESSGPAGNFYYNPLFHDPVMVCIAGGSGITPFMSMIREVIECGLDRTVYLFYGNRRLDEAVFHGECSADSERFEHIYYIPVVEDPSEGYRGPRGLITGNLIQTTIGDLTGKTFYLCGPQGMYDFCLPQLERLGIPRRKIRKEVYGVPRDICGHPGWPKEIEADDTFMVRVDGRETLEARAGEPLMAALEKGGIRIRSLCRSGECSMCRIKLLSGKVFQPVEGGVRKSDRRFGYVHACVSYPLEDLEIITQQ
jgi:ferredoxin-NADP reductase